MKTALALPILLLASCAGGAGHGKIGSFGPPPDAPDTKVDKTPMSAEQTHACVGYKAQVQEGQDQVKANQPTLVQRQNDLKTQQAAIESQKPPKGSSNATIKAYNAKVASLQQQFDQLNADAKQNNDRVASLNDTAQKFNTECAAHSFKEDDLDAAKKDYPNVKL